MRKTSLSLSIAAACLFAVPAFAQLHLGGGGQVGGGIGVNAGQALQNAVPQTIQTTQQMQQQSNRFARQTMQKARKTGDRDPAANARVGADEDQQAGVSVTSPSADVQASGSARADAGLSAAATTDKISGVGRGVAGTDSAKRKRV